MPRAIWVLMLMAAGAAAQTVEGTVIDSLSGNGIPGATVELVRMADTAAGDAQTQRQNSFIALAEGEAARSVTTDSQGRFRLDDVKPGTYAARYRAPGHMDEAMAPARDPVPVRRILVGAGGTPVKVEARMIPLGSLSGRVVDGRGQPVPNARVDVLTGNLMGSQGTDEEGKFRDTLLPGSAYLLSVGPPVGLKPPDAEPDSGQPMAWVRTYYPGVADRAAAAKIIGQPGVSLSDIEIKLQARPTRAVRGTVLNPDGTPAAKVTVVAGEDFFTPLARVESKADGTFEIAAVPDGLWRVSCDVERGDTKLRAAEWVELTGREPEGLRLRLKGQVTLRGRVVMEAAQGQPAPKPPMVRLRAYGHGQMSEAAPPGRPDVDGNFGIAYFYPGVYRFTGLDAAPPGYYLDSIRLGEVVLAAPDVEIASAGQPLTLTYKTNGGAVRGTVENCASGTVLLAPQDAAVRWPQSILSAQCDANNRYQISSVRPGDYYAVSFAADRSSPISFVEFEDSLVSQAARVSVHAGESTSLDLRVTARPR